MGISDIIKIWFYLCLFSLFLIAFRKDKELIYADLVSYFLSSFNSFIITILIGYFILPLTIPDSIHNIFKK